MSKKNTTDASFFLRSLKEEGVEEIYVSRKPKAVSEPQSQVSTAPAPVQISESTAADAAAKEAMIKLRDQALACTRCQELAETRTQVVFGSGSLKSQLMFVGEAPGQEEDLQGLPFVGAAGQLLTKIIESIGLTRNQVFIANTLKCRPPQNRPPKPEEISNCHPYLQGQIELIRPKIICALGTFAAQTILKTETPISKLRGKFWDLNENTRIICTFHPAYLLRNPGEKRKVWEDMKMIRAELDRLNSAV